MHRFCITICLPYCNTIEKLMGKESGGGSVGRKITVTSGNIANKPL